MHIEKYKVSIITCVLYVAVLILSIYCMPSEGSIVMAFLLFVSSALLMVCGAVVLAGATGILTGVSTMPLEERKEYDMDAVASIMGSALITAAFIMLIAYVALNALGYDYWISFTASILVPLVIIIAAVPFANSGAVNTE
ncbi:MAG: DUF3784 domain-containing protein [Candidatus Methanoplasma sp.]|nr:DUF3784 domain-containing protein [Candidatus Methanoplasma sp.]